MTAPTAGQPSRAITEVTPLTQADCALCDHAKQVLAKVSDDFPLQVSEVGFATEEGHRLAAEAGVLFPPGILFGYGRLSKRKLRKTLQQIHI